MNFASAYASTHTSNMITGGKFSIITFRSSFLRLEFTDCKISNKIRKLSQALWNKILWLTLFQAERWYLTAISKDFSGCSEVATPLFCRVNFFYYLPTCSAMWVDWGGIINLTLRCWSFYSLVSQLFNNNIVIEYPRTVLATTVWANISAKGVMSLKLI